ncbi:MAG TPA: hypothetical protein VMP67_05450 [Candidatus Limnocylindria bacterium]|nr:hypothetical protein [Candidatus Limnocylindria bacterium]
MPEEETGQDFGTGVLELLEGLLIPDWGDLIAFVPLLLILGVVGPGLTLLVVYWLYVKLRAPRGRVRTDELQPTAAQHGADGTPVYPPNVPYCPTHELIYPANARECEIDGEELLVQCPVDSMTRVASQQLCRACGTRYQLGASLAPVVVKRHGRPPDGGAAIA